MCAGVCVCVRMPNAITCVLSDLLRVCVCACVCMRDTHIRMHVDYVIGELWN